MMKRKALIVYCTCCLAFPAISQESVVDINLHVNHILDTVTSFDRSKFVTMHADVAESEWDTKHGANFTDDLRDDFLNGYDVYLGRNTGGITGGLWSAVEDPTRSGFADTASLISKGAGTIRTYGRKSSWHTYEDRNNLVMCAQLHPFWPDGTLNNQGWAMSREDSPEIPFVTASGEYMGHYLKHFFGEGGKSGQPRPTLTEVINEPLWHIDDYGLVFHYHNTVAKEIKKLHPDMKVGGYCTAFPNLEEENFQRWEDRWKFFMDTSGAHMDFWTIHLYDFPAFGQYERYRKGSNMEATFDMIEQYSHMKFGTPKEFMISEYGAQTHNYFGPWSPYRDWLHMKSVHAMMMQFMERAHIINQTINFLIIKATWGTESVNKTYGHRLMRMEDEPLSLSGTWVYTEMVKTFQLWADVKGLRADSRSTDPDILSDVYVNGDRAYVILNSLAFEDRTVSLNLASVDGQEASSLMIKRFYLDDSNPVKDQNVPVLDTLNFTSEMPDELVLKPEATYILEYTYPTPVAMDESSLETKYYADSYYQPITAGKPLVFHINGVSTSEFGEAVLRMGVGRDHGHSLKPLVTINGSEVLIPENYRGDEQKDRPTFFGVIEIPVSHDFIQSDNEIIITFPDDGGHISSVTMQNYEFSTEIIRSDDVSGISLYPDSLEMGIGQQRQLTATLLPGNATDQRVSWFSSDTTIVSVDEQGLLTGKLEGEAMITVVTMDGGHSDSCHVKVGTEVVAVPVDTVVVIPAAAELMATHQFQLEFEIWPVDADDQSLSWSSSDEQVATVDENGVVTAVSKGTTEIRATAHNDAFGVSSITVLEKTPGYVVFDDPEKYLTATYEVGGRLEVTCQFTASLGQVVDGSGMKFWLHEMDADGLVVISKTTYDQSVRGLSTGTATGSIPLRSLTPSSALEEGHYYALWISFTEDDGTLVEVEEELGPINIVDLTGIQGHALKEVELYPNPASKEITIRSDQEFDSVTFYQLNGRGSYSGLMNKNSVDISHLPGGAYMVKFSKGELSAIAKLFVQ